ncbi:MAG TPA: hypothetical protein PKW16_12065, partial [Treponemataceae bacterium]|nr:hypothetical protein [Treponemataceae bacterium]
GRDESRPAAAGANEPDISKLSFEERMAYYKSKYGKGQKGGTAGQHHGAGGQKSASAPKRADRAPRDTRQAGKGGQKSRGNRPESAKNPPETKKPVVGGVGIKSVLKRLFSRK